jgi:molecular chaperone GrpE
MLNRPIQLYETENCLTRRAISPEKQAAGSSGHDGREEKEGAMQQNGQGQQERRRLQQTAEQPEREGEPDSTPVSAQVEQQLTAEQQKAEECLDLLRRTQADFVNYRRRMSQEQAEGRIAAQSALLSHLLPVLDDLGRALGAAPPELAKHPWVQGLFLVARRLTTLLDQLGVRQIGTPGELFDPRWHEAIATEARADVPEGTILHVARPGYTLGERVIRPAQVSVAGTPSPMSDAPAQQEDSEC